MPEAVTSALTVIACRARIGGHGAVTSEVLPLLDAHSKVGTGVLLARGAGPWHRKREEHESTEMIGTSTYHYCGLHAPTHIR